MRLRVSYVILKLDCFDVVHTQLLTGYMELTISIYKCDRIIASVGWKQEFTQIRSFLVAWCSRSFSIIGSSFSWARKGQVWMKNICVIVSCGNWRSFHHIFIASFKVPYRWTSIPYSSLLRGLSSTFTGTFPLWTSLSFIGYCFV